MSKRGPPPALKPKPTVRNKSVTSPGENKPLPGESKTPTEKTEAFQKDDKHSTERTEVFQITEITDTFKKSVQTTSASSEQSVSSDSEKLVTENKSDAVIPSVENMVEKQSTDQSRVKKQTTEKQEVDQLRNSESAQSESPVMMRKKSSTASSPHDMEHFKGRQLLSSWFNNKKYLLKRYLPIVRDPFFFLEISYSYSVYTFLPHYFKKQHYLRSSISLK